MEASTTAETIRPLSDWEPGTRVMIPGAFGGGTGAVEIVRHDHERGATTIRDVSSGREREVWSGFGFVLESEYQGKALVLHLGAEST